MAEHLAGMVTLTKILTPESESEMSDRFSYVESFGNGIIVFREDVDVLNPNEAVFLLHEWLREHGTSIEDGCSVAFTGNRNGVFRMEHGFPYEYEECLAFTLPDATLIRLLEDRGYAISGVDDGK